MTHRPGRLVDVGDTALNVVDVGGPDGYPILILHGGPGLDHHEFGDYLDPLASRGYLLMLVDQRGQGRSGPSDPSTWTLERMAREDPQLAARLIVMTMPAAVQRLPGPLTYDLIVRELGALSLETAVWRLTGHPAAVYGLEDRGRIVVGAVEDADLVYVTGAAASAERLLTGHGVGVARV